MTNFLVISSSLDPNSRSRVLAKYARDRLQDAMDSHDQIDWLDAADLRLPLCDGGAAWDHADAMAAAAAIEKADGIILALGIYNFGASAVAKTLVELGDKAWNEKVVGLMCASGGPSSYMAVMGLANSLMLDFRCVIVPRFVFATGNSFADEEIVEHKVRQRIEQLAKEVARMATALRGGVAAPAHHQ